MRRWELNSLEMERDIHVEEGDGVENRGWAV